MMVYIEKEIHIIKNRFRHKNLTIESNFDELVAITYTLLQIDHWYTDTENVEFCIDISKQLSLLWKKN